jgi:hypothetical protein
MPVFSDDGTRHRRRVISESDSESDAESGAPETPERGEFGSTVPSSPICVPVRRRRRIESDSSASTPPASGEHPDNSGSSSDETFEAGSSGAESEYRCEECGEWYCGDCGFVEEACACGAAELDTSVDWRTETVCQDCSAGANSGSSSEDSDLF